jgi:hypothetical protein
MTASASAKGKMRYRSFRSTSEEVIEDDSGDSFPKRRERSYVTLTPYLNRWCLATSNLWYTVPATILCIDHGSCALPEPVSNQVSVEESQERSCTQTYPNHLSFVDTPNSNSPSQPFVKSRILKTLRCKVETSTWVRPWRVASRPPVRIFKHWKDGVWNPSLTKALFTYTILSDIRSPDRFTLYAHRRSSGAFAGRK